MYSICTERKRTVARRGVAKREKSVDTEGEDEEWSTLPTYLAGLTKAAKRDALVACKRKTGGRLGNHGGVGLVDRRHRRALGRSPLLHVPFETKTRRQDKEQDHRADAVYEYVAKKGREGARKV